VPPEPTNQRRAGPIKRGPRWLVSPRCGHPDATSEPRSRVPLVVPAPRVKLRFCVMPAPPVGRVGRGRVDGSRARGRPALLRSTTSGWLRGRRQDVRWGDPAGEKLCGRSVFLGRPRVRVGRGVREPAAAHRCDEERHARERSAVRWLFRPPACWPALVARQRSRSPGQAASASAGLRSAGRSVLRGLPLDARRAAPLPAASSSAGGARASSPSSRSVW